MNDYLDQVEAQLAELTDRGAHRRLRARRPGLGGGGNPSGGSRPPRRTEALALLSAAAVAIAVVAIVVLNVGTSKPQRTSAPATASGSRHSTTAKPPTTNPPAPQTTSPSVSGAAPLPNHFAPQSFTAISELTWWVVGPAPCSLVGLQPPCGAILRTTDGGRNFTALEAPRATLAGRLSSSGYSQIRFADMRNGFAYGPDLYSTHDGGTTWAPVDAGGDVIDLAISDGEVYATVSPNGSDSGRLMRSPVGQDQWTKVAAAGEVSGGLWVLGNEVIVQSGNGGGSGADLLVSTDGGASFGSAPAPSPGLPCDFQAQSPPIIWAQCATGTESGVWRSTDSGKSFVTAHGSGLPPLPNSAVLGAASDTTAVVGYQQLYRTSDAGASWTPTGPSGVAQWTYVGFTDATHGVALGYLGSIAPANQRLYYTTDGGQTYHLVPLP